MVTKEFYEVKLLKPKSIFEGAIPDYEALAKILKEDFPGISVKHDGETDFLYIPANSDKEAEQILERLCERCPELSYERCF